MFCEGSYICESVPRVPSNAKMPTSVFPLALATLIALYNVAQVSCGDQCFNIDQLQEPQFHPCNPSASASNCCLSDWTCLSNGLCELGDNNEPVPQLYTGFCTDPSWGNRTACPKICENNVTGTYSPGGRERSPDLMLNQWLKYYSNWHRCWQSCSTMRGWPLLLLYRQQHQLLQ